MSMIVQKASTIIADPSLGGSVAFAAPTTPGNRILVAFAYNSTQSAGDIIDDGGNDYVLGIGQNSNGADPAGARCYLFVSLATGTTSDNGVVSAQTISLSTNWGLISVPMSIWIYEIVPNLSPYFGPMYNTNVQGGTSGNCGTGDTNFGGFPVSSPVSPYCTDDGSNLGFDNTVNQLWMSVVAPVSPNIVSATAVDNATGNPVSVTVDLLGGFAVGYVENNTAGTNQITFSNGGTSSTYCSCLLVEQGPATVGGGGPNIIIQKVTSPPGDPAGFTIRPSWKSLITLADGQSDTSLLAAGTYSVSEDAIPGWSTVVTVSNGDPPGAIVLASSDITVTFTNSLAAPTTNTAFIDPWIVNIDPLKLTVSDLDGSTDLANLVFNVQDRGQAITGDFPTFVFEGKPVMLLEGYVGMNVSDYLVRFTGLMNTVASDNGNNEYKFSVANYNLKKLTTKVYGLGDDGFTTSDNHPRTVSGHPLDILVSVLNQCAVLSSDIDLAKIHYYRDFIYNGREFLFNLTSAPTAKDFIENELMKPLGMYVWENNLGQVSINSFYPSIFPFGGYTPVLPPIATLDLTNTIEVPLAQEADLVNQVIFKFDANQGGNSDFAAESITDYDVSITKYGLVDGHTVESQGLRSAFQGYLMSNLIAFLIFLRYGLKNLFVDPVPCFWTLSTLEPGDIIAFNEPFVPDRMLGLLGITGQTFEVMDRTWNFMTGVVEFKLLAIDLSKFKQYLITSNGEGNFTAVSTAHQNTYMYQSDAAGVYSNSSPGNTLG